MEPVSGQVKAHQLFRQVFTKYVDQFYTLLMNGELLREETIEAYANHVNPYLAKLMGFAGFGVEVSAEGSVIRDHDGREFLDFLGGYGVFSVGHRNQRVIQAVKDQLESLPLSGKTFFSSNQAMLAKRLAGLAPEGLEFCFFSNSGAEAAEAAIKFARKARPDRPGLIAFEGGYHGKTMGALSVTGREKYRKPFEPLVPGASFVPYGDADALRSAMNSGVAAVLVETIQGEGGIRIPEEGFLTRVREICDEFDALLIVDEVQTGLGRTGKMFGVEHEGVRPDLMTLAKALGGGVMPIGCTMGTEEIWDSVFSENPLLHTSTFGGNPLACAAALATLDVIESEDLCTRSEEHGALLLDLLREACKDVDLIHEVRGKGLMIGVEFAMDEVGELVVAQMVKRGVVVAYTLNNPRVIRFEPPLTVAKEQIEKAATAFGESIREVSELIQELTGV